MRGPVLATLIVVALGVAHLILPLPVGAQDRAPDTTPEVPGDRTPTRDATEPESEERGWLGIAFQDPADRRPGPGGRSARNDTRGRPDRPGVVVSGVLRGSPADRAGIRPGDVLVRLEGEPIGPRELGQRARNIRVGDSVRLTVRGSAGERRVELVAGRRPESIPPPLDPEVMARVDSIQEAVRQRLEALRERMRGDSGAEPTPWFLRPPRDTFDSDDAPPDPRDLRRGIAPDRPRVGVPPRPYSLGHEFVAGARMVALSDPLAEYFHVDRGVLTVNVLEGSPADEAGLRPGDVLVAVGSESVETVEEVRALLLDRRGRSVEIRIVRQGEERTIRLPS